MGKFLKNFGLGLIFMICSPLLACLVVIAGAIGIIYFLLASLRILFRFFRGLKPISELEIDARVAQIKERLDLSMTGSPAPQPQPEQQPIYVTQNYYQTPPQGQVGQTQPNTPPLPPTPDMQSTPLGPDIYEMSQETSEISFDDEENGNV